MLKLTNHLKKIFFTFLFFLALATPLLANYHPLDRQARQQYDTAQYSDAITTWQTLLQSTTDPAQQAETLTNLSLAYQHLGQWDQAKTAIDQSLTLTQNPSLRAQSLDTLGRLQLSLGHTEQALTTWQQAADLYRQHQDPTRLTHNQINQAQALQTLGFQRRAQQQLQDTTDRLTSQPDSLTKAIALLLLGNTQRLLGDLPTAQVTLTQSLTLATTLGDPTTLGQTLLSLAQLTQLQGDTDRALTLYKKAATLGDPIAIPAQLHRINLLIKLKQPVPSLDHLLTQIDRLPISRATIYTRLTLAKTQLKLGQSPSLPNLKTALQQARTLQDPRAESAVLGTLGHLYERQKQWADAQRLTDRALALAQTLNATDLAYQWHWQQGRLLRQQNQIPQAITAYDQAITQLQTLRADLIAVNPDMQFSFRDQVEPAYRQFVELLLQSDRGLEPSQTNLRKARNMIEALHLAELDNFFNTTCLTQKQNIDSIVDETDPTAAILYTAILSDRLEVILKLPQQPLRHYVTRLPQAQIEQTLSKLRQDIVEPDTLRYIKEGSQTVYNWLIQPGIEAIAQSQVKTLVFVLDGPLRSIPMSALYNGHHFLIEDYAVALSPSLHLFPPAPSTKRLNVLAAGITQPRLGFSPLKYVTQELNLIRTKLPSRILLNAQFTAQALQDNLTDQPASIVHLATHGRFSATAANTFLIAWDKRINVTELDMLLRSRDEQQPIQPLELLVLSACSTAAGDSRAVLGLAGVAWKAGARTTIASLWNVNDQSTADLMGQIYPALTPAQQPTRAETLRQAQLKLLKNPKYQLPLYWAPYVLVGNWL